MPTQSIVVTCALDGQSGSHVGSATHSTATQSTLNGRRVAVLHSPALARARPQRHSTTATTGQRHLRPRAHSDRHCRVHPARRRRQRARGPVDSAHARDTPWLGILFGLATEPERAIVDSVWPSQSIALAQWSFAQWGGARMASWRGMPSLPDGCMQLLRGLQHKRGYRTMHIRRRLGFARRQSSSECPRRRRMVRRRTSPYRSDDSQPVKTEAVCKRWASSPG